jgi:hypothetical protein
MTAHLFAMAARFFVNAQASLRHGPLDFSSLPGSAGPPDPAPGGGW